MADQLTNGTAAANNTDVEMKEEETAAEVPTTQPQQTQESYARRLHEMLIGFQTSLSSIQQAQDSNPPSSQPTSVNPAMLSNQVEHQSTIQPPVPAIATPPAASSANARPGSMPPQPSARPSQPVAHGGPPIDQPRAGVSAPHATPTQIWRPRTLKMKIIRRQKMVIDHPRHAFRVEGHTMNSCSLAVVVLF